MKQYKKIIFDVILNILATAIPLLMLQLVVLPLMATRTDDESYGLILTLISIITVIANSLGNSLNNIRLIKDTEYRKAGIQGDFPILLMVELMAGIIAVIFAIRKSGISTADYVLICILLILWAVREYYIVTFRLNLNFKGIVINNLILVFGYMMGLLCYLFFGYWEMVYIVGILLSLLYTLKQSRMLYEKFTVTFLFKNTFGELSLLVVASVVNNLLNYADRMLIYPLIGGAAVSVYYAATLFGKIVGSAVAPINSVVLSYLSKKESLQKKMLKKVLITSGIIACTGYVVCRSIASPALSLLYPQWVEESMKYVSITTLTAMISMITSTLAPFVLKFCAMKWQLLINVGVLVVYVGLSFFLFNIYGFMGFCLGVLLSNIVKMIIMILLAVRATREEKGDI